MLLTGAAFIYWVWVPAASGDQAARSSRPSVTPLRRPACGDVFGHSRYFTFAAPAGAASEETGTDELPTCSWHREVLTGKDACSPRLRDAATGGSVPSAEAVGRPGCCGWGRCCAGLVVYCRARFDRRLVPPQFPETLRRAVQIPCLNNGHRATGDPGIGYAEPAGVRGSIKAAHGSLTVRLPTRLSRYEGAEPRNHARRAALLFGSAITTALTTARPSVWHCGSIQAFIAWSSIFARILARGAGSLDIEPSGEDAGSAAAPASRNRPAAFAGGQYRPARRSQRMAVMVRWPACPAADLAW